MTAWRSFTRLYAVTIFTAPLERRLAGAWLSDDRPLSCIAPVLRSCFRAKDGLAKRDPTRRVLDSSRNAPDRTSLRLEASVFSRIAGFAETSRRGRNRRSAVAIKVGGSVRGRVAKSISASDVGQTFLSAGSGDFPVPGFRVKLSALAGEVGKLRNRQARKPALQFRQHALRHAPPVIQHVFAGSEPGFKILRCRLRFAHKPPLHWCGPVREIILAG